MVGIIILDYNNAKDTISCIESVMTYTIEGTYKIIVVENGSNETTVLKMSEYVTGSHNGKIYSYEKESPVDLGRISLLISCTNDGYAEGNNKALRWLEQDDSIETVLILNNDILFIEDIVSPLLKIKRDISDCGIISPLLVKKDGREIDYNCARHDYKKMQFFWEYLFSFKDFLGIISRFEYKKKYLLNTPSLLKEKYFDIELPSGSCMMIDKDLFKSIGYFDNHTFLYFEENILYQKLKEDNRKNYLVPGLKCIHLGASTSKKVSSMFTMRCQMKSTAYYLRAYRHDPVMAAYVNTMSNLTIFKIWVQERLRKMS